VKIKTLKLKNGEKVINALGYPIYIDDGGDVKLLEPTEILSNTFSVRKIPLKKDNVTVVSYEPSNGAMKLVNIIEKQFSEEVKVITTLENVLLMKGVTRGLIESGKIMPNGKPIYNGGIFIGYNR